MKVIATTSRVARGVRRGASIAGLLVLVTGCVGPPVDARSGVRAAPEGDEPSTAPNVAVTAGPSFVVVDANGDAAEGAEVWLVDRGTLRPDRAVIASRTTGDWVATTRAIAAETRVASKDGTVRFEREPSAGFLVVAELEEQLAAAERVGMPDGPIELRLVPRARYRVRVLDVGGSPAVGVPVTLAAQVGDDLRTLPSTAFTDEEGLATMYEPPAAAFLASEEPAPPADAWGRVALVRIPSLSRPRVAAQREGVATIVLPPTVPLTIVARHAGYAPDHWDGVLQAFRAADGSRSDATLAFELESGVAVLPHVEIGVDLRIVAVIGEATDDDPGRYVGSVARAIEAASGPGEALTCTLALDGGVLVTARCIDAEGAPLARTPIDVFVVGEPATSWTVLTDDAGHLRWLLARVDKGLAGARIGFRARGADRIETGRAVVPLAEPGTTPPRGSTVDLGVVVVR